MRARGQTVTVARAGGPRLLLGRCMVQDEERVGVGRFGARARWQKSTGRRAGGRLRVLFNPVSTPASNSTRSGEAFGCSSGPAASTADAGRVLMPDPGGAGRCHH